MKIIVHTGKQGYIQFLLALAKTTNMSEKKLKEYNEELQNTIKEGLYTL